MAYVVYVPSETKVRRYVPSIYVLNTSTFVCISVRIIRVAA